MPKSGLGLARAIQQLRADLAQAVKDGADSDIHFPVGAITVEFQVGLTKKGGGELGFDIWVLELAASGEYAKESVQTVTVTLEPPVDRHGNRILVSRTTADKPS
ncbi:trypco2 family protein [Longispora sp. K20-0274]|uniref:trypco2 family protein n=1 Tax=Longispora sp. K20-0274 TaxID=3088255 RepID=UPI00399982EC